ncbi:MAG: hypothetical protein P8Z31_10730, partial [Gammaproteobacteria bacterium]
MVVCGLAQKKHSHDVIPIRCFMVSEELARQGLDAGAATAERVMLKTRETVEGTDGTANAQGIEVLLAREDDGKWRLE